MSDQTMKAVRFYAPGDIRVEEIPVPVSYTHLIYECYLHERGWHGRIPERLEHVLHDI